MSVTKSKDKLLCILECQVDGHHRVEIVCLDGNLLIGSAHVVHAESDTPVFGDLYVAPDYRGQGIGTALTKVAMKWADNEEKSLYLHVQPHNPAKKLYEELRFEYTGEVNENGGLWMIKCALEGRLAEWPEEAK